MKAFATVCLFLMLGGIAFGQDWKEVTQSTQVFREGYIQVVAESEENQSRFKAKRAAEIMAQRRIIEVVQGLSLAGRSLVKDGALASDVVETSVSGTLKGAVICGEEYNSVDRYATVCMRLGLRGQSSVFESLYPAIMQQPQVLQLPASPQYAPAAAAPAPAPVLVEYDGIILDVRGRSFRPALVNRILSEKHQILFEPSRVENSILIERGCGGYTTDEGKAKALLSKWGSSNPLTITVADVSNSTDVIVSSSDASQIFVNDQKSNILAEAKIVFVLK